MVAAHALDYQPAYGAGGQVGDEDCAGACLAEQTWNQPEQGREYERVPQGLLLECWRVRSSRTFESQFTIAGASALRLGESVQLSIVNEVHIDDARDRDAGVAELPRDRDQRHASSERDARGRVAEAVEVCERPAGAVDQAGAVEDALEEQVGCLAAERLVVSTRPDRRGRRIATVVG